MCESEKEIFMERDFRKFSLTSNKTFHEQRHLTIDFVIRSSVNQMFLNHR